MTGSIQTPAGAGLSAADPRPKSGKGNGKGNGGGNATQPMREVKILMLHGYTQSGPLFRAKTRALEKLIQKALAPLNLLPVLFYATGPNRLSPRDIPGWEPSNDVGDDDVIDSWAWFRKDEAAGSYRLLDVGMQSLAKAIEDAVAGKQAPGAETTDSGYVSANADTDGAAATTSAGGAAEAHFAPVDGVLGFSQGGSMAGMLTAAMEILPSTGAPRPIPTSSSDNEDWSWVSAVRKANRGVPLKFAVVYSGFFATPKELAWLYEPKIGTPTLHFLGSLDTVVEESRSRGLVERCEDPAVVMHPGGHYVPVSKQWAMPLVGFIGKCMDEAPKF